MTTPAWLDRGPRWQRLPRFVGTVLAEVFVEPVRSGWFRTAGWPRGLTVVMGIVVLAYVAATVTVVAAGPLRSRLPLVGIIRRPPAVIPVGASAFLLGLVLLAATVFQTGALHAARWLRAPALLVSFAVMVAATADPHRAWQLLVLAGSLLALVLLQVLRWRAAFRWWEYVVVLCCFLGSMIAAVPAVTEQRAFGGFGAADVASIALPRLEFLAVPAALIAGYAIAQWAFTTVVWTVDLGRSRVPTWVLAVCLILLLGWRLIAEWWRVIGGGLEWGQVVAPLLVLLAGVVVWVVLDRLADRSVPGTTRLSDLSDDLRAVAWPVALLLGLDLVVNSVFRLPANLLGSAAGLPELVSYVDRVDQVLQGRVATAMLALGLLAWAVILAGRADRGKAELVGLMTVFLTGMRLTSARYATDLLGWWAVGALVVLSLVLLVRRRLGRRRLEGLLVAAGLVTVMSTRSLFDNPVEVLLGGNAALVLGLVWNLLTSGEEARGDGSGFPRPARVCLLLANSLVGITAVAYHRLTLTATATLQLGQSMGDAVLGGALLAGALLAVVVAIRHGEDPIGSGASSLPPR